MTSGKKQGNCSGSRRSAAPKKPIIPQYDDLRLRKAARAAEDIIEEVEILNASEIEVELLAYRKGLVTLPSRLTGARGRLIRDGGVGIISVSDDADDYPQARFVIAHELGHHILHPLQSQLHLCTEEDVRDAYASTQKSVEAEASTFAATLLMPAALFGPRCDTKTVSLDVVRQLARDFQVSQTAAALRYVQFSPERCAIVFTADGTIRWYRKSPDFEARILPFGHRITDWTYMHNHLTGKPAPEKPERTRADAWLEGDHLDDDAEIFEHSFYSHRLGFGLSLLWIPSDADY